MFACLLTVPTFMFFAQARRPKVGQWWLVSVAPYGGEPCPDEEYYAEILTVHSSGTADLQDLEEAADPEHQAPLNKHY